MKTRNKALLLALCALLLVVTTVFATLAYLTSTSNTVTNTFSVGNVTITMDEAPVDEEGQAKDGDRVTENSYKLIAGKDYDKDPTIHVGDKSEDSYLFVKIDNQIAAVIEELDLTGWTAVTDGEDGLYVYGTEAQPTMINATTGDVVVFDGFTVQDSVGNTELEAVSGKTITLKAFAIQAEGVDYATAKQAAIDTL